MLTSNTSVRNLIQNYTIQTNPRFSEEVNRSHTGADRTCVNMKQHKSQTLAFSLFTIQNFQEPTKSGFEAIPNSQIPKDAMLILCETWDLHSD
jgi:hypothetical protein